MSNGDSVDTPKLANLTEPTGQTTIINGMALDMVKMTEASKRLGVKQGDVMSVAAYRNARGVLVPDYDTARIEKRANDE